MDISALLPLILGGNKDATALLAAVNAIKRNRGEVKSASADAPPTDPRAELLKRLRGNPRTRK